MSGIIAVMKNLQGLPYCSGSESMRIPFFALFPPRSTSRGFSL
jgi:hypothetical protein